MKAEESNRDNFHYATFYFKGGHKARLHYWRAENQFPEYFERATRIEYEGFRNPKPKR